MMKRTFGYTMAVGGLLALCVAGAASKSAADPISQVDVGAVGVTTSQSVEESDAMLQFKDRNFDGALKLLRDYVKKNPDLPPPQVIMAQWFARANVPVLMRNALEQAVVESPDDPEAYLDIGQLALQERRLTEAGWAYAKAESLLAKFDKSQKRKDVLRPLIVSGLATVAEARGDWAGAQKQLEAWLKFDPKSAPAMQRLAHCLFQQRNAAGALEKLKEAAKADAATLTPEAILAQWYEQANDRENANKWMAVAIKQAPKDLQTRLAASRWALATNQVEMAQAEAEVALQIEKSSLEAQILRGAIALFQKDYTAAERYCESAFLQAPGNAAAANNLALALVEQKDGAKQRRALQYAQINSQQYPNEAEVASTYGWVLYKNNRVEDADKVLQAVVASGLQFSADTAYYAARVDVERGREVQARKLLETALKSTGPFAMREEAKALLEQLTK